MSFADKNPILKRVLDNLEMADKITVFEEKAIDDTILDMVSETTLLNIFDQKEGLVIKFGHKLSEALKATEKDLLGENIEEEMFFKKDFLYPNHKRLGQLQMIWSDFRTIAKEFLDYFGMF